MRFLELRPDSARHGFNLHPRITLLRGLDPAARVALVGFLHSIAGGDSFGWDGTVDVHGVEMPLDSMLELVGETADAALVVEAKTLVKIVDPVPAEPTAEQSEHQETVTAVQNLEAEIVELAEELGGAKRLRSEMRARLAAATARRNPEAGMELDRADGRLGRMARQADRPDPWTGMSDPERRVELLEASGGELDQLLGELPTADRPGLAAAVAVARASLTDAEVPSPQAQALAAAWTSIHQRLVGLESRMEATGGGTEAVAARLDAARAQARAAEDAALPRAVLADESARLEALHERVIELDSRSNSSIRRISARKELPQVRAEFEAALKEIGYPTWAAFHMGNGIVAVTPERVAEYERSRSELEAAEVEWAELMARLERDTDLQSVLNAVETAHDQAIAILGSDPYADTDSDDPNVLVEALNGYLVEADSVAVDPDDALTHLRQVLDAAGCVGHEDLAVGVALVALGETWLRVLEAADDVAVRALRDRERVGAELKELILLGAGSRVDRLDTEREEVYAAETAVAEHREALVDVYRSRLELHMLVATEVSVAEEHDAKLELVEGARVLERLARHRVQAASEGPQGLEAVISQIPRGRGGAVPLVVVMGDANVGCLDAVLDIPDDVQILVIGDTHGMSEWADTHGSGVVKCAEGPAFV